jgi:hypothetical protein
VEGGPPPVEAFEPVAQLITPKPPIWLKEHLRRWLPMHPYAAEILQPSRAEMRTILTKVAEAASVLKKALDSSAIVEFLNLGADQPRRAPGHLQATLVDIANRAAAASGSPALVDAKGRTKAGRGRALPKAGISAQTYCALLIAETWLCFNGNYPPPRNKQAEKAADIYWRLLGNERQSWGNDKVVAWRRHFRAASKDESAEMKALRAQYQRHLGESARIEALTAEELNRQNFPPI